MEEITFTWIFYLLFLMNFNLSAEGQITDATSTGECGIARFGRNCRLACHCLGGEDCHNARGRCPSGCAAPWNGNTCQKKNVAFSKPTFQSSTLRSLGTFYSSSRAVDGQTSWPQCSHSEKERNPYWTVDLVLPTTIYHARILNRNDCCQDRLKGFQVFVSTTRDLSSATLCYSNPGYSAPQVLIEFQCTTPVIGRYVSIVIPRLGYVTLCDVEIYECSDFTFGRDCVGECHCRNEQEVCDKRTGVCKSGCSPGWSGNTCQTVCPDFKFGQDCQKHCHCQQFNEPCDKVTGFCQSGCLAGKGGAGCQSECGDYMFGSNCEGRCHCLESKEVCDKSSGSCTTGCAPGWKGPNCAVPCAARTYGFQCRGQCQCFDETEVCDSITGFCSSGCASGWTGSICKNACEDGKFGKDCKGSCNCYDRDEVCDKKTGSCRSGCAGQSRGIGCAVCPAGRFGSLCNQECLCSNITEQCARLTGYCLSGCSENTGSNICFIIKPLQGAAGAAPQGLDAEAVGGIIGAIVAVLLILMLAVLICLSKRHKSKKSERPRNILYENCAPDFTEAGTAAVVNNSFEPESSIENVTEAVYQNTSEVNSLYQNPMEAEELFDYVQGCLNNKEELEKAFTEIPVPLTPSNVAVKPENLKKNRYRHMLPFDRTRVIIHEPVEDGTDYINASYIDGYQRPRAFIATQGPTAMTMCDFWNMIWQEESGKIVMLTNLMEAGRRKCEQYWPDEGSLTFGDLTLEHLAAENFAHYTVRSFKLSKDAEVKTVSQFHFHSWSDHDAPDDTTGILHLRDKIRDTNTETQGPTVVHCSAGVGRTGTYIALDILIETAQTEGTVAIDNCIHKLRGQRMHMIQNSRQYEFLHKALRDAILCTNSSISAGKFLEDSLTDSTGTQTRIGEEFMALGKCSALEIRKKELLYEKMTKNRSEDIIASDSHRVFLSTNIPDRTNYINAIFVPSFYKRQGLIVTQTPLLHTVIDLWRMVYEQRSSSIVVLQENPNEEEESYIPGSDESLTVGPFLITLEDFQRVNNTVITRTLKLQYGREHHEEIIVKQFSFLDWKAGDVTPSSPASLITLLELVDDWHRECGRDETIVHCLNGAFRSGIYAAANMILERLKSEHVVNVMQTVHQLRGIRTQFIYTPEQYQFCYEVAKAFLLNFSGYQNFN